MMIGLSQSAPHRKFHVLSCLWNTTRHGHYLANCYGFTYSHSDSAMNDKRKGIKFQ